ncbi:hypothetical protein [uncultured Adlercreutzia sp.]|uniref:hypothetical protein n=1 Tax=uncultured Adlercreutzia sp. TaxID=875803 RepID=UPI0025FEE6AB|nr:hypothetical protein [uncultured Adlercreutzia sp.]
MIRGEAVEVMRFDPSSGWSSEAVADVLPGAPTTEGGSSGAAVTSVEFHFPKGWDGPLRGAWLCWRGRTFQVLGDPQPYAEANTPGRWNRPAKAAARFYGERCLLQRPDSSTDEYGRTSPRWETVWEGSVREPEAAEAAQWKAQGESPEPSRTYAAMPDADLLSAAASSLRAVVAGRQLRVASVSQAGGASGEVLVLCEGAA